MKTCMAKPNNFSENNLCIWDADHSLCAFNALPIDFISFITATMVLAIFAIPLHLLVFLCLDCFEVLLHNNCGKRSCKILDEIANKNLESIADELTMVQSLKNTVLRASRVTKMLETMDLVSVEEETDSLHSSNANFNVAGKCLSRENLVDQIVSARKETMDIREQMNCLKEEREMDTYLLKRFLAGSISGIQNTVAKKILLQKIESHDEANKLVLYRKLMSTMVMIYFLLIVWYIMRYGYLEEYALTYYWIIIFAQCVAMEMLLYEPVMIFLNSIAYASLCGNCLHQLHNILRNRSVFIMKRHSGLMRFSNAVLQHLNPACRAARLFPYLTSSRLLISLSDHDLPLQTNSHKSQCWEIAKTTHEGIVCVSSYLPDDLVILIGRFCVAISMNAAVLVFYYASQFGLYVPLVSGICIVAAVICEQIYSIRKYKMRKLNDDISLSAKIRLITANQSISNIEGANSKIIGKILSTLSLRNSSKKYFSLYDVTNIVLTSIRKFQSQDEFAILESCSHLDSVAKSIHNIKLLVLPGLGLIPACMKCLVNGASTLPIRICIIKFLCGLSNELVDYIEDNSIIQCCVELLANCEMNSELEILIFELLYSISNYCGNHNIDNALNSSLCSELIKVLINDGHDCLHELSLAILLNLIELPNFLLLLSNEDLGLYRAIHYMCFHNYAVERELACNLLQTLAQNPQNLIVILSHESLLIESLVQTINTSNIGNNSRAIACSILCQIASMPELRERLSETSLHLCKHMVTLVKEEEGKIRLFACSIIGFLSTLTINQRLLGSIQMGFIDEVIRLFALNDIRITEYCCFIVRSITSDVNIRVGLISSHSSILDCLVSVMLDNRSTTRLLGNACAAICNLALSSSNRSAIVRHSSGVVFALIHVINRDTVEGRVNACGALSYLAIAAENRNILLHPSVQMISTLEEVMRTGYGKARSNAQLALSRLREIRHQNDNLSIRSSNSPDSTSESIPSSVFSNYRDLLSRISGMSNTLQTGSDMQIEATCIALTNIALSRENKREICASRHGIILALSRILTGNRNPEVIVAICTLLWSLSDDEDVRNELCSADIPLASSLLSAFECHNQHNEIRYLITGICRNLRFELSHNAGANLPLWTVYNEHI